MIENSNDNNKDKEEDLKYFQFDKIDHPNEGELNENSNKRSIKTFIILISAFILFIIFINCCYKK